jgi:hypothetical protein
MAALFPLVIGLILGLGAFVFHDLVGLSTVPEQFGGEISGFFSALGGAL